MQVVILMPSAKLCSGCGGEAGIDHNHGPDVFSFAASAPVCLDITSLRRAMMELALVEGGAASGGQEERQKKKLNTLSI